MGSSFPAKRLLQFLDENSEYPRRRVMIFAVISGLANGMLLAVVNHAASLAGEFAAGSGIQIYLLAIYTIILIIFIYTKKYTLEQAAIMVEHVLRKVRIRIMDKVRNTELPFIESTGHSEIFNCLSHDTEQISVSASTVFASMQAGIMLIFAMLYIAWLTPSGFAVTVGAIVLGVWAFELRRVSIMRDMELAVKREVVFFESVNHTLHGFKEIKLNSAKSRGLHDYQGLIASEVEELKIRSGISSVFVTMFSQVFFYVLIAIVLFVWPYFELPEPDVIIKLTASILFIIGPLELLVGSLPLFMKADVAVNNLYALEARLDTATDEDDHQNFEFANEKFQHIKFSNVCFEYQDVQGVSQFKVGPIDLEFEQGEIVFIIGGNGSGKSTLMKVLTGLYYPSQGNIMVDDEVLDHDLYHNYRELFSIIFTDFHLFDRLYGLEEVDRKKVKSLLAKMELSLKTNYRDGAFTTTDLSTGQRKRLAYVAAMLDDKQIYVFDEWAADQDPVFRKFFYEVLLPELRDQGKTIIAVTHDDKYFSSADRVLKMDEGVLVDYSPS